MAFNLIWSPVARLDLADLHTYIAESNPQAARQFIHNVFRSVEQLIEFPESGRIVPEFADPNIREVFRKPCRIIYRIQANVNAIQIVRVWHAARGIPQF